MASVSKIPQETWNLAMVLYAQGVRPQEISKQLNVSLPAINTRASRDGWQSLLARTRDNALKALDRLIQDAEIRFRTALCNRFMYLSEALPAKALTGTKELDIQKQLQPAIANAKVLFGWNESNKGTPMVRINVMGTATVERTVVRVDNPKESLVSSTPVATTEGGDPLIPRTVQSEGLSEKSIVLENTKPSEDPTDSTSTGTEPEETQKNSILGTQDTV